MNKGLEIRKKKLDKARKKRYEKKPEQIGLVRFVFLQWEVIERVNGKYRHTGRQIGRGLQVENRVYLTERSFKLINSKSVKITRKFRGVPEWASEELKAMYQRKMEQFSGDHKLSGLPSAVQSDSPQD